MLIDAYPPLGGAVVRPASSMPTDRREAEKKLLESFGIRTTGLAEARRADGPGPVTTGEENLSGSDRQTIARMIASFERSTLLAAGFEPETFSGNALFFRAAVVNEMREAYSVGQWTPYISGRIEVHDVDSDHFGMLDEPFHPVIGRALNEKLEAETPRHDTSTGCSA